jgi:hypothetical protein
MKNREKLIEAFIAETGLKPSECVFVEEQISTDPFNFKTVVWVKKRDKSE